MKTDAMCQSTCKTMKSLFFKGDTIQRQISIRLTVLARLLRNNFDRKVSALNGSLSQWTMIGIAARYPGATQRTLAEHLGISEASAGRLIDKLCTEGLLERADREDDRRARAVHVTDAARPLLETIGQIATESEEKIFKGFSHEELEQMRDFLDRIYANAGKG